MELVVSVGAAAVAIWGFAHTTEGAGRQLLANGAQLAAAITAAAVPAWRLRGVRGRPRRQLALLSAAGAAWAVGQLYWTVSEARGPAAALFPSPADLGFVLVYPAVLLAVVSNPSTLHRSSRVRLALDALIVALSLVFVTWAVALDSAAGDPSFESDVLAIVYPIADIVVVAVALVAMTRTARRWRTPVLLLVVAFGLLLSADAGFASLQAGAGYRTGSVIDLGWILGWLMVAAAAAAVPLVEPAGLRRVETPSRIAQLVPIVSLGVVAAVAVVMHVEGRPFTSDEVLWWTGLALFGSSVARSSAARAVRGHEKVPGGGQFEVPGGGQVEVPTPRLMGPPRVPPGR